MTVKCFNEGGKIVETKDGKCASCGRLIYFRYLRNVKSVIKQVAMILEEFRLLCIGLGSIKSKSLIDFFSISDKSCLKYLASL